MISGELIEQKPSVKYPGARIDNRLNWKDHIKAVAAKVTRAIAMIRHTKEFIPIHMLKMLFRDLWNLTLGSAGLLGEHVESLPAVL